MYKRQEYNERGWIKVNDVLKEGETARFYSNYASIKFGNHYNKTPDGFYVIPTGKYAGALNTFVYVDDDFNNHTIAKVVRVHVDSETDLDMIRGYLRCV